MIKVLETLGSKTWPSKIEAESKIDDCFTICQYKTEEPKKMRYLPLFL